MHIFALFVSVGTALFAGFVGSFFTASSVRTWYIDIIKPEWNPPSWVFGPVWTVLYIMMGTAAYLIWQQKEVSGAKVALAFYIIQLIFNIGWSLLFFGLKNPAFAFFEIIALLVLIIVTAILFWRIEIWAGILFIPYILWVSFATYLNYTIWQLN